MSHPSHDPRLGVADVPRDAGSDGVGGHRHRLAHAVVTVVFLSALAAMVAWLILP